MMKSDDLKGIIAELFPEEKQEVFREMIKELDALPAQVALEFSDRYVAAYEEDKPLNISSAEFNSEILRQAKVVLGRYRIQMEKEGQTHGSAPR